MKSIMITGANEGIGYHMVRQFLEDGKSVAVIDLNTDQLETLNAQYSSRMHLSKGDVRDAGFVQDAALGALSKFGAIDCAIHNACLCPFAGFEALRNDECHDTFDVNYFGAVNLIRAVLPIMKKQKSGRVFFTSSAVGITGFPGISAYASSKGALEALAKCLNLEYREDGVSFHILHPPLTRTRSAEPLPVPDQMKADAEGVGRGLARRLDRDKFVICHNNTLLLQTKMMYLFPIRMGKFLHEGVKRLKPKGL